MPQDGIPEPRRGDLRRAPAVPSAVLATLVFVATEIIFFCGLISSFVIVKAGIKPGMWPPPWQPRLPVEATAGNTVVLLASGVLMLLAGARFARKDGIASKKLFVAAALFGAFFVVFQSIEWARLLGEGLRMTTSNHGAFFYLIVGTHGLHVIGALIAVAWVGLRLKKDVLTRPQLWALQTYWSFVVVLWPVLYVLVYL